MIWIMLIAGRRAADLGLGTAPFAFGGGTGADSVATVHAALNAGVRLIDTALRGVRQRRPAADRDEGQALAPG